MPRDQFVGPLLPVKCGDTQINYTTKTKLLGLVIDNKLAWRDQAPVVQRLDSAIHWINHYPGG